MSAGAGDAHAITLGPAFDLLAAYEPGGCFFEREGLGIATSSDEARDGSIAAGAVPFAGWTEANLRSPARVVRRGHDGETRLVRAPSDRGRFEPSRVVGSLPHEAFRQVQLTEQPAAAAYARSVAEVVERIRGGTLSKVVLARTIEVDAGRVLDTRRLLHRLRAAEPHCYVFAAPTPRGTLVGASPELLISRIGSTIASTPLAGSAPRSGDPDEDRSNAETLLGSDKNRQEHAIVVDAVAETLGAVSEDLAFDAEPVLLPTANVWHLATRFRGTLRDPAVTVLDLVRALHPTPAVGGEPTAAALDAIAQLEPFERGSYAGPVGWMDERGDGEWAIALRCAELRGERATLYAGAGIVLDSDPAEEVDETERKFRAFLDSLRWG